MPILTPIETYQIAKQAGFPPETAKKMVAIAQRESSLNTGVFGNLNPVEASYGLWQINWNDPNNRALLQKNGITESRQLYDPLTNAKAAYLLWNGNDNNLNTAWYINRTGNKYGYAEKYQQNYNALPDFESIIGGPTGEDLGITSPDPVDIPTGVDESSIVPILVITLSLGVLLYYVISD